MASDSAVRSVKASRLTHGGRHSRLYHTWWNMKARCKYDTAWGETKVLAEWVRDPRAAVTQINIGRRIREGASPEDAISYPRVKGVPSPWRQIQS